MTLPPPSAPRGQAVARSVPPLSRLSYFDVLFGVLWARPARLDELRTAIGLHIDELASRGEARRTRDWRNPLAYRDTVIAGVRELLRWKCIEPLKLSDDAAAYERMRDTRITLTDEGRRIAELKITERREQIGQRLFTTYTLFRDCLHILSKWDVQLPELSDKKVRLCFPDFRRAAEDHAGWERIAASCAELLAWQGTLSVRRGPFPSPATIAEGVGTYLVKRLSRRTPKNLHEVTSMVNKALAGTFLRALGFLGEWNSFDRCLRWGRDLYVTDDGRHVFGVPGWVAWSAATFEQDGEVPRFMRRGLSHHREEVKQALVDAYGRIARARRSSIMQVPLIPIYEVRETAAFACRVVGEVVDRVLGDLAFRRDAVEGVNVQLLLADLRAKVPSARPFYYEDHRYFYVTMQGSGEAWAPSEASNEHR